MTSQSRKAKSPTLHEKRSGWAPVKSKVESRKSKVESRKSKVENKPMAHLFEPMTIRGVTLRNRIAVSPMCQYSCADGLANDWHFVHLGSRAVGGAAIVFCEATAVTPEARISPEDLGIWSDRHAEALARIVRFIHQQGSLAGIQLAHAGRKASTYRPWSPKQGAIPANEGGWTNVVAPSAIKFHESYPQPREITREEIRAVAQSFADAARRARHAAF